MYCTVQSRQNALQVKWNDEGLRADKVNEDNHVQTKVGDVQRRGKTGPKSNDNLRSWEKKGPRGPSRKHGETWCAPASSSKTRRSGDRPPRAASGLAPERRPNSEWEGGEPARLSR